VTTCVRRVRLELPDGSRDEFNYVPNLREASCELRRECSREASSELRETKFCKKVHKSCTGEASCELPDTQVHMGHAQVRPVVSCLVHKNIAYVKLVVSCVWQREQTVHVELHTWSTWISSMFQENYRAVIKEYSPARILKCPEHFQQDISQHHPRRFRQNSVENEILRCFTNILTITCLFFSFFRCLHRHSLFLRPFSVVKVFFFCFFSPNFW